MPYEIEEEQKYLKEQLMLYIKENQKLVDELRNCRHNSLNMIHGINGFIEFEDWDGLKNYFYDILESSKRITDTNLSSIEKIKNPSLRELLSAKLKNTAGSGIDFKVMADEDILVEPVLMNENDLCKVTGEFLDNAVEAASDACIKKVSIYIFTSKKSTSIIIENTFKEKPNISLLRAGFSTKGEGRGAGLQSVSDILSKYPHILNNTFVQHCVFVQELQIIK